MFATSSSFVSCCSSFALIRCGWLRCGDGVVLMNVPFLNFALYSGSTIQYPPLPRPSDRGTFLKHLFSDKLCLIVFYVRWVDLIVGCVRVPDKQNYTCQPVSLASYKAGYLFIIHLYISLKVIFSFSDSRIACAISAEYEKGGRRRLRGGLTVPGATGINDSETIGCCNCCCCASDLYCFTEATMRGWRRATGIGGGYSIPDARRGDWWLSYGCMSGSAFTPTVAISSVCDIEYIYKRTKSIATHKYPGREIWQYKKAKERM